MTFGFHEAKANYVRLISVNDDKVITVQSGVYLGKPAINEAKTKVYATTLNPPHTVYEYKKKRVGHHIPLEKLWFRSIPPVVTVSVRLS